ncbi:E3 ubiquitin-protein ligase RNF213-like, partial [Ruditapes philippinarum]|uniref:E3 ubiquitin-protein ligase RNF213-like n=1 Tax=Ruditapes philippinarum TaxID=129788 RepID=UPI00295BAA39
MFEFEFDMKIATEKIVFGKRIPYKYCIEKIEKTGKDQYTWEHYLKESNTGMGANRTLTLIEKWNKIDVWHQYDGVVEKEPSTWDRVSSFIFSWRTELIKHAKKGVDYFSSNILQSEDSSYSVSLEQLEMLFLGFKRAYYHDGRCWDSKDNKYKEDIGGSILDVILETAGSLQNTTDMSASTRERQVALAIAAVFAAKKLDLSFNVNLKSWQKVCEHLIMRPDPEKKTCLELDILEKYFPENRQQMKEAFLSLGKYISSNSKNPSWLFLMPWIHFLYGLCSPFDKPAFDVTHDKKDPTWWGISQLGEHCVKYFRGKTDHWEIPIEKTLDVLEPMFEMDYLLPRSFVTAVRLRELDSVIATGKIPTEIILANLFFHIKDTRPSWKFDYIYRTYSYGDVTTDERLVEKSMKTLLEHLEKSPKQSDKLNIHQEKMQTFFSSQVFLECTKTNRVNPFSSSIGIMLHCLSSYEEREDKKTISQKKYALGIMQPCVPEVFKWIESWSWQWVTYMEDTLKCWNMVYAPDSIKSQPLCEEWNKQITKVLWDKLQTKVCHESYSMTNFIQLYCQKIDTFNPAMQDCLTKAAFQEIRRFGDLISDLFLKEWNKSVKDNSRDTQQEILQHFLKWPPFTQFVKIYLDRSSVDATLKKQENLKVHKVNEFCIAADVSKVEDLETFQPALCAFKVSQTVIDILPQLQACSESSTFMRFWIDECQSMDDNSPEWDTVSNKLQSGEIKFRDIEKILGNRYQKDYDNMIVELKTFGLNVKCIHKRVDQLKKYRHLGDCVKGAKTILKFANDYNLKGDFKEIRIIANHGENDLEMKSFDESVMNACDFLKDLTPQREKCLNMFVQCRPLVQWLKESMKKAGLKELKVFVDLAFMSAGDEPINIARVQCLHSAVTGYAPLIFDLDESSGYKELLNLCAVVWKELEANPKLPDKLRDTNRQIQWLKEIKKAHGSVEVTSLMQAEAINANGIFTVGKNAWKKDADAHKMDETLLAVMDIIKLTVPEKEGKSQLRNYTFSQCQDLQSRLMLVAGKAEMGTDSVDRFTMIFDSITRLSNVYMKLCSSGCVLFKDWTARFLCYPKHDRPVCAILEFGQGDSVPQLKGRRSEREDLKDIIPELAKFMECCLDEWLDHIKEKRKTYLHLNYYTVDQLVILQRELVKMGIESEPSHLVYPLLSAVKENCTPDDLIEAMAAAKEEIDGDVDMEAVGENADDDEGDEMPADATEDEKRQNFIQELVVAGYDEALALRALQFMGPEDVTAGIVWCMDHDEDSNMSDDVEQPQIDNQPMREQVTPRPIFTGWSQSQTDIQTMILTNISGLRKQNDVGSTPLISDLTALWKQFLDSISSNIRDYLSLEHLGLILKYLARKDTKEVSRSLPPGFKEGKPNLIICPSGDVLMTTLSIYMMDRDQPLPMSDEILLCTPNTTKDEVDIFWRRAIFDGGRKIHCLVNADMLDYDVSEAAERCLEEYLLEVYQQELKYRLFVICGSDNEYRSTIVSSLDKFKRQPLPANTSHLRDYLANKLIVQEHDIVGVRPAACVDRQRSTVRVIKSWRAGVGKTLFKHRREEELSRLNRGPVKSNTVSIPLQEKTIDLHYVIERLLEHTTQPGEITARLFHIDVAHEVENGVDYLLFNLLLLGCLTDKTGFVWRKSATDMYLIETTPLMMQTANRKGDNLQYVHPMLNILPDLTCRSPQESLQIYSGEQFK